MLESRCAILLRKRIRGIGWWLSNVALLFLLTPAICSFADEPAEVEISRPAGLAIYLACGDVAGPGKVIQLDLQGKRISDVKLLESTLKSAMLPI